MEAKYYTPQTEEFYIGFEYEELKIIYTDKGWYTEKAEKWIPKVYDCNYLDCYYLTQRIKRKLFNSIRVKYLDTSDIEGLGFKKVKEEWDEYWNNFENETVLIRVHNSGDRTSLYISKKQNGHIGSFHTIFDGTIKNKSELKILLKQLGVNE
jgi:hypothetical protein